MLALATNRGTMAIVSFPDDDEASPPPYVGQAMRSYYTPDTRPAA